MITLAHESWKDYKANINMRYTIEFTQLALDGLKQVKRYNRQRVVDSLHQQLGHQPTTKSRNRKQLDDVIPSFDYQPPIWELRVGEYRVFYDVDDTEYVVHVRAVRRKPSNKMTKDII